MTLRGSLARASLRLAVVPGLTPLERYAWVADALTELPGSGIIYVLTVAESERVAGFLTSLGHRRGRLLRADPEPRRSSRTGCGATR